MVLEEGVVVEDVLNAHIVIGWATPKRGVTIYMAFLTTQSIFPYLNILSQSFLMKNIRNI